MNNNPFTNRKDPLVDSIKAIMEDTHMRNQAEGLVCEAFGVLNKNALANEEVTPFELACEEIYNQLKEGVQIDELSKDTLKSYVKKASKDMRKTAHEAGKESEADDYWGREGKERYDRKPLRKSGKRLRGIQKATDRLEEEKAKKDYDKDGKIESPKDEVWGSRLRAAKMAGKMEEMNGTAAVQNLKHKKFKEGIHPNPGAMTQAAAGQKSISESVTRKHFQQVADLIKGHESQEKRNELATHHASIFAKQNPRFNHEKFHAAAGSTAYSQKKMNEMQIDELYGKGKLKDIIDARQEKEHKAKLAYKRAENKMMDARSETGKAEKVKEKLRLRNISKPGDPHYNWAHSKRKISEEVFEELYISINEQALYAIETNQLEAFINNLTEEEFDFLDEEIVNEIVVQKSQMRPGETLGMTMNRLTGKTAVKGGANDPSSSNFKGTKPGTPATNTPGTQGVATGKSFDAIDKATNAAADKSARERVQKAVAGTDYAKPSKPADSNIGGKTQHWKDQGAAERTSSSASQASTIKAAGDTPTSQTGTAKPDNNVPTPASVGAGSRPSNMDAAKGADTGGGAKAPSSGGQPGDSASSNVKKLMSMNESTERKGFVTVGNMRIKLL